MFSEKSYFVRGIMTLVLVLLGAQASAQTHLWTFDTDEEGWTNTTTYNVSWSSGKVVLDHTSSVDNQPFLLGPTGLDFNPLVDTHIAVSAQVLDSGVSGAITVQVLGFNASDELRFWHWQQWDPATGIIRVRADTNPGNSGNIDYLRLDLPDGDPTGYDWANAQWQLDWISVSDDASFNLSGGAGECLVGPVTEDVDTGEPVPDGDPHWWDTYTTILTDPAGADVAAVNPQVVRAAGYYGGWYGMWYYDDQRFGNTFAENMWNSMGSLGVKRMFYFDDGEFGDYAGFFDAQGDMEYNGWSIPFWTGTPAITDVHWYGLEAFLNDVSWAPYDTAFDYGLPAFTHPDLSPIAAGDLYGVLGKKDINGVILNESLAGTNIDDQLAADSLLDTISSKDINGNWIYGWLWHTDTANPQLAGYRIDEMERLMGVLAEPYGTHIDNWGANNLFVPSQGAFGDWSVAGFRDFMAARFTTPELSDMGISDINTFDIRTYLLNGFGLADDLWTWDPVWNSYKIFKAENGRDHSRTIYNATKAEATVLGLDFAVTGNAIPLWPGAALVAGATDILNFEWIADGAYPGFSEAGLPPNGKYGYVARLGAQMSDAPFSWINLYVHPPLDEPGHDELHKVMAFDTFASRAVMDYSYWYQGKGNPGSDTSARFINDFIEGVTTLVPEREYFADIAIVFNPWCDVAASTVTGMQHDQFLDEYSGWADYLTDTQRQWDVLLSKDIDLATLNQFPIVVLPSLTVITDTQATVFEDYVNGGGFLVITGDSGDRWGSGGSLIPRCTNALDNILAHANVNLTATKPGRDYRLQSKLTAAATEMNTLLTFTGFVPGITTDASIDVGVNLSISTATGEDLLTVDLNNYDLNVGTDTVTDTPEVQVTVLLPPDAIWDGVDVSYVYAGMADPSTPIPMPGSRVSTDPPNNTVTIDIPSFSYYFITFIEGVGAGTGGGGGDGDTDEDGYSDDVEIAAGTDPDDDQDTPILNVVWVDFGWADPPYSTKAGTESNPLDSIEEAIAIVAPNGTIRFIVTSLDSDDFTGTINTAMTLAIPSGGDPVQIGLVNDK